MTRVNPLQAGQLSRRPLGVAAGGHNEGRRIGAVGGPQGLAGLGVRFVGHGAGVQHIDVGGLVRLDYLVAGRHKASGQGLAIGQVELAAVGLNGHGAGRLGHEDTL